MKRAVLLFIFSILFLNIKAQSTVMEIGWKVADTNYMGLLVLYPNNYGHFKVKFYLPYAGWTWCIQDASFSATTDIYGNVTSYINCSNPRCSQPYAPDNFVIFPNGQMYTQDGAGTWSTLINATLIQPMYWQMKMKEYGL